MSIAYQSLLNTNIITADDLHTNSFSVVSIETDLIPQVDNALNIGAPSLRWAQLYLYILNIVDLIVTGSLKSNLNPDANYTRSLGTNLLRYFYIFASNIDTTAVITSNLTVSFLLSDLIPVFDINQDLGTSLKRWKTLYSGTVNTTDISISGSLKSNLNPDATDTRNLGTSLLRYLYIFASNIDTYAVITSNLTVSFLLSDLIPVFNINQDLGTALKRWKTLYSGTVNTTDILISGSLKSNLNPDATDTRNLGTTLLRYLYIFASNIDTTAVITSNLTVSFLLSNLIPVFDNDLNLGSSVKQWKNLYINTINTTGYVKPTMTTAQIQAVISNTAYNKIEFETGTYTLTTYLNVNRSNVILNGNQAYVKLGNGANSPNIFVGDVTTNPPTIIYENIQICNFNLDGNKANQTSETCTSKPWIYNNTVGVNLCHNVIVKGCELNNAKSGGFTATYNSKYITVQSCYSTANTFDGLTAYGSENVSFINNHIVYNTTGAGISVDINVLYLSIANNIITNNNLGIFARYINDCVVTGNVISANSTHGFFLSGYNQTPNDQGCARWSITGNSISNNGGHGLFMQGCNDFVISGNNFYHNNNGINITSYSGLPYATYGVCSRNNITGNTISGNTNVGIYNDSSNNYSNGSRDNYITFNVIKSNTSGQVTGDLSSFTLDDDTVINTQSVILKQSSGYTSTISAQTAASNISFNLPTSNGTNGYILSTDGSGNTFWIDSVTVSSNPTHQICDSSCNIPFPVSYTPSSYISPMIISVTFPSTGSYRAVISYNILVAGLGTSGGQYSAYVSDGTYNYAPSYGYILNGTTQMIQGNSITSQSSYSNVTKSFTLHFNNTQYCSLLAAASVGYDPYFTIYLVKA